MAAEALENFRAVTGCENDDEAAHYLDACNSNLAAAVDLFFQRQQADTVPIAPSHRYSNRRQQANQLEEQPSTSNDDVAMISDGDDEVRAPMAPTSGVIVEQSYNQTYNLRGRRRAATNSVFDRFRDFRAEAKNQREVLTRDQRDPRAVVETDNKRQTLESLFRPPVDLIHEGNWESARHAAQTEGRWLLVNVQNAEEFACQALNRDVWANDGVKELVSNNFVFWQVDLQVYHDSPDGVRMESYYRLNNYPAIFVVDPRTGEFMISFGRVQDAVSFCDQVTAFLDEFPDFTSRDRQMNAIGASASSSNVTSAPSPVASATSNGSSSVPSRKRPSTNDEMKNGHGSNGFAGPSAQPPTKSAKFDDSESSMPDIDALINGGKKLTTVDQDEWKKHLGTEGESLSLLLRLPNGAKEQISVLDSTPLKAVFLFAAGRGYSAVDYLLVLSFPRRQYSIDDNSMTLKDIGLNRREIVDVERK